MKSILRNSWLILLAVSLGFFGSSCKKEEVKEVISGFSYTIDPSDFKTVIFTNASQNFSTVSWDFGDGSAKSSEEDPTHTYPSVGTYTVTLTAVHTDGTNQDVSSQTITIVDPDAELTKLVGDQSKTWKFLREVGPGRWPLEVGPYDRSSVWWGLGRDNQDILNRPCSMNDEFIFGRDGSYTYNSNGDFWAEGGVFEPANDCFETTPANLVGPGGSDLSAFGDGVHTFTMGAGKLTVEGLGAFIGLQKIGTDSEVSVPQTSVTYNIIKLYDGAVDTLILETEWKFPGNVSGIPDAYWRITLVHYDDPGKEPPVAGFNVDVAGTEVTCTNKSYDATSYSWDFGDGATSNADNPTHTYSSSGVFTITLTATRGTVSATATKDVTISGSVTEADLIGGPWKVRNAPNSIFVGPGLGDPSWWQVPANFLDGSSTGADDWSCITDDEFIFSAGGVYEYKTNGSVRNDGYMGSPNGCWTDAEVIAAGGNGQAFLSGVHSWAFTPADMSPSGRPIITLTNGASGAAFIGFYKGYYGGENADGANPPNGGSGTNQYEVMNYVNDGTTETITISVDISAAHDGSASWSAVLVR
ncbi:MAG: PKD domain-containing protein [Lewinellaceae bacterium]|nr:PKD domain-containing protein [Lewinellaceae bacterium]